MAATTEHLERVDALLDGARLLGLELETSYRVLAATVEPPPDGVARVGVGSTADRRLQVLLHPCAEVVALLLRLDAGEPVVERFAEAQLPDVVAALDGPRLAVPVLADPPAPRFPAETSLRGVSSATDGRSHRAVVDVRGAGRRLVLLARYDDVEVRDAAGTTIGLGG